MSTVISTIEQYFMPRMMGLRIVKTVASMDATNLRLAFPLVEDALTCARADQGSLGEYECIRKHWLDERLRTSIRLLLEYVSNWRSDRVFALAQRRENTRPLTGITEHAIAHPPRFPPEVWDRIFDLATYVPYTLTPEIFEKASFIGKPYNDEYHPALRAARATKYNLRVKEFMAHASHLGWWAQRLDVTMSEVGDTHQDNPDCYPEDSADHLAEVIKYLPNLTIVSFALQSSITYGPMPPTVVHALRGCASSLQVLDCEGGLWLPLQGLEELLINLPHMRILNCHHLRWAHGLIPRSILSSLNTLGLSELIPGDDHPDESGSQETHVCLEVIVHTTWCVLDQWSDFMQHYGRYLTSIQLRCAGYQDLGGYLDMIKQFCPSIRCLTIFLPSFQWTHMDGSSFPTIEYLGLRAAKRHLSWHGSHSYIILFMRLATLKVQIPTLSVVQLVDHVNVEQLCEHYPDPSVRPHVDRVLNGMLRMQDHEGNPLSVYGVSCCNSNANEFPVVDGANAGYRTDARCLTLRVRVRPPPATPTIPDALDFCVNTVMFPVDPYAFGVLRESVQASAQIKPFPGHKYIQVQLRVVVWGIIWSPTKKTSSRVSNIRVMRSPVHPRARPDSRMPSTALSQKILLSTNDFGMCHRPCPDIGSMDTYADETGWLRSFGFVCLVIDFPPFRSHRTIDI
ncbi:hypothetical protein EDC04DRAFT_2604492 [Pisolithus marmoratus]|nr:hypothetical protein EDC04DRAFT_2604492 [Pisolithus marmoratus]